jgi:hypothetical protein
MSVVRHPRVWLALDVVFLAAIWLIAAARGFNDWVVLLAVVWTIRVIVFDRRGYRLVLRGRRRPPSKDPARYR